MSDEAQTKNLEDLMRRDTLAKALEAVGGVSCVLGPDKNYEFGFKRAIEEAKRAILALSQPVEVPFVNLGTGPVDMNANVWPSQEAVDADEAKVIKALKSLKEES